MTHIWQILSLVTFWISIIVSGGRFAWYHWHMTPPPDPPAYPDIPDDDDYIERGYRYD